MIAFLKGTIEEISEKSIFLDVNGIGYEIYMPTGSASMLPGVGEKIKIHTYLQISENGIGLYGFLSKDELNVFKLLITVNGIGPKGAVGILSALSANELRLAVLSDDDKAIAKAPGIGAKTAKKLILELKDKIGGSSAELDFSAGPAAVAPVQAGNAAVLAHAALQELGYSPAEINMALKGVDPQATTEEMVRYALRQMVMKG